MSMTLTPHFSVNEMCKSNTAVRYGIQNVPNPAQLECLRLLCVNVLEPIRAHFGKPIRVSSGFRNTRLNGLVLGSATSQHKLGQAADIEIEGIANARLADWIKANCPFDQLILEFAKVNDPSAGWVHVSYGPRNRREFFSINK